MTNTSVAIWPVDSILSSSIRLLHPQTIVLYPQAVGPLWLCCLLLTSMALFAESAAIAVPQIQRLRKGLAHSLPGTALVRAGQVRQGRKTAINLLIGVSETVGKECPREQGRNASGLGRNRLAMKSTKRKHSCFDLLR